MQSFPKESSLSNSFSRVWYTIFGWIIFTHSLHVVTFSSKLNILLKKVSHLRQRKMENCINVVHVAYVVVVCQQSHNLLVFCTLRLATSSLMFPSTKSKSYSRMLRVSRTSIVGLSCKWIPWNWLALRPFILLMKKIDDFEVSSSSRWVPYKWRAGARKRLKLSSFGCLVFSSYVRQLIVPFLNE